MFIYSYEGFFYMVYMYMYLFIWFFSIVTNFQILVYKENVCPFISFNSYKFLKMGIQRKCVSSFCLRF